MEGPFHWRFACCERFAESRGWSNSSTVLKATTLSSLSWRGRNPARICSTSSPRKGGWRNSWLATSSVRWWRPSLHVTAKGWYIEIWRMKTCWLISRQWTWNSLTLALGHLSKTAHTGTLMVSVCLSKVDFIITVSFANIHNILLWWFFSTWQHCRVLLFYMSSRDIQKKVS